MKNPHMGSTLDSFLDEEGILEECTAGAIKQVISWQLKDYMEEKALKKSELAKKLNITRAMLDRLLDKNNTSVTLTTIVKAVKGMGKTLEINIGEKVIA
jgi:predicted XRE-type DNA-binding protein